MNHNLLILPVLTPLVAALTMLCIGNKIRALRLLYIVSGLIQLAVAVAVFNLILSEGTIVLQLGNWAAPFGIVFVADLLSATLVLVTATLSLATALYAPFEMGKAFHHCRVFALLQILLTGVNGAFLTGDLFNLFVWFEVMLISSFVLLSLGNSKQAVGGAFKYVLLNLVSSVLFLTAVGLLYGKLGTLNFAHLAARVVHLSSEPMLSGAAALLFAAFSIKSALFPVHFWLPASYHTAPALISAVFGGLLTKVGVYAILRVFTLVFPLENTWLQDALLILSLATMVFGVLGAMAQMHFRRLLSFHIISQIGYMTLGLALYSPLALAAAIFYIIHNMFAKTNLFLFGGLAANLCGSEDLRKQGGLFRDRTMTALLFLIPALGLAGLPPLSGFFAKFLILKAALEMHSWTSVAVALAVGLGTLYSMLKIWSETFWKPAPQEWDRTPRTARVNVGPYLGVTLLAGATVSMGLGAGFVFQMCERAAGELLNQRYYINAVLGEG